MTHLGAVYEFDLKNESKGLSFIPDVWWIDEQKLPTFKQEVYIIKIINV